MVGTQGRRKLRESVPAMEALLVLVVVLVVMVVMVVMVVVMVVMVVVMVVMVVVMVDSIEVVGTQLSGGGRRESFEEIRANKWQPWRKSGLTRTRRASLGLYCAPFQRPLCPGLSTFAPFVAKSSLSLLVRSDYSSPLNTFSHRLERR